MILFALLLQSATTATPPVPEKFSILVPVTDEPCTRRPGKDANGQDVIVCGNPLPSQTVPNAADIVPDGPTPSNRFQTGSGALAAQGTPCPISRSCIVGFGPPVMPILKGAADLAKRAFAKKPDKTGRVPIDLSDDNPPKGRIDP
ncbi:MAG: hypothetical protein J0I47_08005 [Sphingomonas sp.]|uniref:hypothetical protein n=1 Tax=Sphingomonas sp. TaxID=28214 RepID=UPI001ACCE86B|nr:hypothetical protein [Sphingomonas sp.]MBN8808165.1 hypothetical protein [Sphingomonas sp.]